jgi:beta-1,4-N-acetylglucosaminyltransferase
MFSRIFITVGTTDFNTLVEAIDCEEFLNLIVRKGCTHLTIQIGRGELEPSYLPDVCASVGIELEVFRFKATLSDDMMSADLIICHAGAGSITDALSLKKHVMVVVNNTLMDNHQTELARAVVGKGYCFSTEPDRVVSDLEAADFTTTSAYPPVDYTDFHRLNDELFS